MRQNRVLVTGGAGFIGSHVVDHCRSLGMEVVVADSLRAGFRRNVPATTPLVVGDLEDPAFVQSLWRHGPFQYVYHLAAYAAEHLSHVTRRHNYRNNLLASVNLINESINHGVQHFVFCSSIAVYGSHQAPMHEDMVPRPEDPYGIAKFAVEMDLAAAQRMFGLNYTVFRPHNVYGERQNLADPHRNVVAIFLTQLRRDEAMTVFGDGSQSRAFTHVDDVAPLIARAPLVRKARNQVFNVGADTPVSVRTLAEEVAAAVGVPARIRTLPGRMEVQHAFSDHHRVREIFGVTRPPIDLKAGLKRTAAWSTSIEIHTPVAAPEPEIHRPSIPGRPERQSA